VENGEVNDVKVLGYIALFLEKQTDYILEVYRGLHLIPHNFTQSLHTSIQDTGIEAKQFLGIGKMRKVKCRMLCRMRKACNQGVLYCLFFALAGSILFFLNDI